MFGGTQVFISGPCFNSSLSIVCDFDGTRSEGVYLSSFIAMCVSPRFFTVGRIPLSVSHDGGSSFDFQGEFTICEFRAMLSLIKEYTFMKMHSLKFGITLEYCISNTFHRETF